MLCVAKDDALTGRETNSVRLRRGAIPVGIANRLSHKRYDTEVMRNQGA